MEIYQIYFRVSQKVGMAEGGEDLTSLSLFLSLAVSVIIIIINVISVIIIIILGFSFYDDDHHHHHIDIEEQVIVLILIPLLVLLLKIQVLPHFSELFDQLVTDIQIAIIFHFFRCCSEPERKTREKAYLSEVCIGDYQIICVPFVNRFT